MLKDIKYQGMTANTSDYECPDGDLEVSLGVDLGEDSVRADYRPTLEFTLPNGNGDAWRIMCVHHTPDYMHYLVADGNRIGYVDGSTVQKGEKAEVLTIMGDTVLDDGWTVESICPIGNTLAVTAADGSGGGKMFYMIWRENRYVYLGDDIPEVNMQFGLQAAMKWYSWQLYDAEKSGDRNGTFKINVPDRTEAELMDFTDKQKESVSPVVMSKVARFINEVGNRAGRFVYPFFVRYAYQLYDGTYTHHSAPVLMTPCCDTMPIVIAQNAKESEDCSRLENCDIFATPCVLDWHVTDKEALETIATDWKDIVVGISIFVSPPLYTYDQSGKAQGLELLRRDAQDWYTKPFENVMLARVNTGYNGASRPDKNQYIDPEGYINDFYCRNGNGTWWGSISEDVGEACNNALREIEDKLNPNNKKDTYQWWDVNELMKLSLFGIVQYLFGYKTDDSSILSSKSIYRVRLPEFDEEVFAKKIKDTAAFYKLGNLEIDKMGYAGAFNGLDPQYLGNLVAHERLPDDFLSHERKYPKVLRSYNGRLHMANVTRYAYEGFSPFSMFPRQTCFRDMRMYHNDTDKSLAGEDWLKYAFVHLTGFLGLSMRYNIESGGKTVTAGKDYGANTSAGIGFVGNMDELNYCLQDPMTENPIQYTGRRLPSYIFYPTLQCKAVGIYRNLGDTGIKMQAVLKADMEAHNYLYGTAALEGFSNYAKKEDMEDVPPISDDRTIRQANTVYVADVNNPFKFSATNTISVGSGSLLGIVPAVEALSQGQFGEYPMYALTSEGVWSLRPNEQGVYVTVRPVSRDVCSNPASITQIDHSVVFTTEQGLMMLHGNSTDCLSDILDVTYGSSPLSLPKLKDFLLKQGVKESDIPSVPFRTFLSGALLMYDYSGKRIIVYNPAKASDGTPLYSYAYVFFIKGRRWGVMPSSIIASANTYPDAVAQDEDGNILNLSLPDYLNACKGVLVTRPFKLGQHDILKTVDTVIQRGKLRHNHVSQILYASNDLISWMPVWSSGSMYMRGFRGTPYKYFKLALCCDLDKDESLYGFTVQFTPRLQDQPR